MAEPEYQNQQWVWAKIREGGATTWHESVQADNTITHYITIRFCRGITADFEAVLGGVVYRIRRGRDLNSAGRYLLLECEELGAQDRRGGHVWLTPLLHVDFDQPKERVFNRAKMRRAFVKIGKVHMRDARRLVMRRGRSAAGDNPGFRTGRLARSIGYYVPRASKKRPGLMVRIAPNQKRGEGNRLIEGVFYPALMFYGVKRGARRKKSHHKGKSGGSGWRIAPRNNYMADVLESRRSWTRYVLNRALRTSLKPQRKKK